MCYILFQSRQVLHIALEKVPNTEDNTRLQSNNEIEYTKLVIVIILILTNKHCDQGTIIVESKYTCYVL